MKKVALILIAILTLSGCANEVEFNSPALQGNKNYLLWRATYYDAVVAENGRLIIYAGNDYEKMTFTLPSLQEGTYRLSDKSVSKIDFVDVDMIAYSTRNTPDPEGNLYPEIGSVTITKIEGNTITGDFRFIAFTEDGMNSVGFNDGIIYKVPVR